MFHPAVGRDGVCRVEPCVFGRFAKLQGDGALLAVRPQCEGLMQAIARLACTCEVVALCAHKMGFRFLTSISGTNLYVLRAERRVFTATASEARATWQCPFANLLPILLLHERAHPWLHPQEQWQGRQQRLQLAA